ncbi:MAG: hypothetical protein ACRC10_03870 [Thermoguttaceae bacterium]
MSFFGVPSETIGFVGIIIAAIILWINLKKVFARPDKSSKSGQNRRRIPPREMVRMYAEQEEELRFKGDEKPTVIAKWEAEFFELTRQMNAQIDTKMSVLSQMMNEANRTCQRLNIIMEQLEQRGNSLLQQRQESANSDDWTEIPPRRGEPATENSSVNRENRASRENKENRSNDASRVNSGNRENGINNENKINRENSINEGNRINRENSENREERESRWNGKNQGERDEREIPGENIEAEKRRYSSVKPIPRSRSDSDDLRELMKLGHELFDDVEPQSEMEKKSGPARSVSPPLSPLSNSRYLDSSPSPPSELPSLSTFRPALAPQDSPFPGSTSFGSEFPASTSPVSASAFPGSASQHEPIARHFIDPARPFTSGHSNTNGPFRPQTVSPTLDLSPRNESAGFPSPSNHANLTDSPGLRSPSDLNHRSPVSNRSVPNPPVLNPPNVNQQTVKSATTGSILKPVGNGYVPLHESVQENIQVSREKQIQMLLNYGLSGEQIAYQLNISREEVDAYMIRPKKAA